MKRQCCPASTKRPVSISAWKHIGKHTRVITTGVEISGQIEALCPPDPISRGILVGVTQRGCVVWTYTAIAPIVSHTAEKRKSAMASKDGVDRKTLGGAGNCRCQKCGVPAYNKPYRIQTSTIVAPEATMEYIRRPPIYKLLGDPHLEGKGLHHHMAKAVRRDNQIYPRQQQHKQR